MINHSIIVTALEEATKTVFSDNALQFPPNEQLQTIYEFVENGQELSVRQHKQPIWTDNNIWQLRLRSLHYSAAPELYQTQILIFENISEHYCSCGSRCHCLDNYQPSLIHCNNSSNNMKIIDNLNIKKNYKFVNLNIKTDINSSSIYQCVCALSLSKTKYVFVPEFLVFDSHRAMILSISLRNVICRLNTQNDRILVLGVGGGALPSFLKRYFPNSHLDCVDTSPCSYASEFFGFSGFESFHLSDAINFLRHKPSHTYSYIFLDIDSSDSRLNAPPREFLVSSTLYLLRDSLTYNGIIALSVVTDFPKEFKIAISQIRSVFSSVFSIKLDADTWVIFASPYQKFAYITLDEICKSSVSTQKKFNFLYCTINLFKLSTSLINNSVFHKNK